MSFDSNSPAGAGSWGEVAAAVHSALQQSAAVVLTVVLGSREMLQIDIPRYNFEWARPLEEFPVGMTGMGFASHPAADFSATPKNLDGLLWVLGNNAFQGAPASWLDPTQRVRLSRWPNMPRHMHSMQQMYMLAALGNAYFTAAELAAAAKTTVAVAQDLINALSLMQLLKYSSEVAAPVIIEAPAQEQSKSLFARLRARLGR